MAARFLLCSSVLSTAHAGDLILGAQSFLKPFVSSSVGSFSIVVIWVNKEESLEVAVYY